VTTKGPLDAKSPDRSLDLEATSKRAEASGELAQSAGTAAAAGSPEMQALLKVVSGSKTPLGPAEVEEKLKAQNIVMAKGAVAATLARLPMVEKVGRGLYQYKA